MFDLDDTLYAEEDYVHSALLFAGEMVSLRFALPGAPDRLLELRAAGEINPIEAFWDEFQLPLDARAAVVSAMREHLPAIQLRPDAEAFVDRLRVEGAAYAIISDGRSVTQRAKLAALGCLDAAFISISEEVGIAKTDPARFRAVEQFFGGGAYVYVGDNPAKDFVAPNSLGWITAMLAHRGKGVHPQNMPKEESYRPRTIIRSFAELPQVVAELI